jgi:hypothetical protein
MSFLVDAPWQVVNGYAIGRVTKNEKAQRALEVAIDATFFAVSVPMYLNAEWTEPIWKPTGAESGRDWMINSQVFHFEHKRPSWRTHLAAAALFATYPLWLRFGLKLAQRRRS